MPAPTHGGRQQVEQVERTRVGHARGWNRSQAFSRLFTVGQDHPQGEQAAPQAGRDSIKSSTGAKGAAERHGCHRPTRLPCRAVPGWTDSPFGSKQGCQSRTVRPVQYTGHQSHSNFDRKPGFGHRDAGRRYLVRGLSAHSRTTACYRALGSGLWGKSPYRRHFPEADAGWMACVGTRRAGESMRCRIWQRRLLRLPKTIRKREDVSLHVRTRFPQVRAGDGGAAVHMLAVKMGRG